MKHSAVFRRFCLILVMVTRKTKCYGFNLYLIRRNVGSSYSPTLIDSRLPSETPSCMYWQF